MRSEISSLQTIKDLSNVHYHQFTDKPLNEAEFTHVLKVVDCFWMHSGDPRAPHAELTSGKCSNGFIDVLQALKYSNICHVAGQELARIVRSQMPDYDPYKTWVIGSDHAGIALSHSTAIHLGCLHDNSVKQPDKSQLWSRFTIPEDHVVIQVEELVTTQLTLRAVREGINKHHPYPIQYAPFVVTLVHRSSEVEFDGKPVHWFAHYDIQNWDPNECPLCAQGSPRLKPKVNNNWAILTGTATISM